jgi:hypothetical protein
VAFSAIERVERVGDDLGAVHGRALGSQLAQAVLSEAFLE